MLHLISEHRDLAEIDYSSFAAENRVRVRQLIFGRVGHFNRLVNVCTRNPAQNAVASRATILVIVGNNPPNARKHEQRIILIK